MTTATTSRRRTSQDAGIGTEAERYLIRHRRRHERGFWAVAFAYVTTMAAASAPTPLLVLYQRRDHFGPAMLTVAFAVYAVGVLVSLLLAGHVSDAVGRRRVLIPALALQLVACLVFLLAPSLTGLLTGRVLSGLSIGVLTSTATAHMTELHAVSRPRASTRRAELATTAANLGGIAVGPLIAGCLAQWAPSPLRLPFQLFIGLLVVAVVAVMIAPETREASDWTYRPQRIAAPGEGRGSYVAALAGAVAAFAVLGLFVAMAPSFLAGTLHQKSHAIAGAVTFSILAAAAVSQLAFRRVDRRVVHLAWISALLGLTLITAGVWQAGLAEFVLGGILTGAGAGLLFKAGVTTVIGMSTPEARAGLLTGLFVAAYIGLAVPAVGLGISVQHADPRSALTVFVGLAVVVILLAVRSILTARRTGPGARS